MTWVIYDGCNKYWAKDLQGWVSRRSEATWFFDSWECEQEAVSCGGTVIGIDKRTI